MRKKSKGIPSKRRKMTKGNGSKTPKLPLESTPSDRQVETHLSELPAEVPSTSQSNLDKKMELLGSDDMTEISVRMKYVLDKCFENKSEMIVNRRVLEDLVSETLGGFYCNEEKYKHLAEAKQLTEKCKTLQAEQIKLNRLRYSLKKQVEDAKHIIKKMIDEKKLIKGGFIRRIHPAAMKREVRSTSLQVCTVGPMFVNKFNPYSTSITSRYTERILSQPEEQSTPKKRVIVKEVDVPKKVNKAAQKVEQKLSVNSRVPARKDNNVANKSNVTTRRMSTRRTKVGDVQDMDPGSPVKIKQEFNKEFSNVINVSKQSKVADKQGFFDEPNVSKGMGSNLNVPIKEEVFDDIVIKEEIIDDDNISVVEISEDEEIEEKVNIKQNLKVFDEDVSAQVSVKVEPNENPYPQAYQATSSKGAGPLIKVRSPEYINEQFIKSLNASTSTKEEEHNISFCHLPKYPLSPKYPPGVSKPPPPILQIGRKNNSGTQGIMLTWSFANMKPNNIDEYQLFAYQERRGPKSITDVWKKVGDIKALPLPMACYLSQFIEDQTYHFIIRAVDNQKRLGDFSIPAGIKLQKLDPLLSPPPGTIFKVPSPKM